jgi:hypothetical protein
MGEEEEKGKRCRIKKGTKNDRGAIGLQKEKNVDRTRKKVVINIIEEKKDLSG